MGSLQIFHQNVPRKWMNIFEHIKKRGEADDFMGGLSILGQTCLQNNMIEMKTVDLAFINRAFRLLRSASAASAIAQVKRFK